MAHTETQDSSKRAPQVCSHCKSIKKGCDKRLPSCSQCIKRRAVCRYGERVESRRPGEEGANRGSDGGWPAIPRAVLSTLSPSIRLTTMLMESLSDALPSHPTDTNRKQELATTHSTIHSQVCHIIRSDGQYIDDITLKYFKGVDRWLPIISQKRFNQRLKNFQSLPTADFSMLLLTMSLITQHPSKDSEKERDREVLYLATKTLFTQVQSFIQSSLYIIQAGVILATYEHAHAMIEASYVTIGTTARMAFAMGLHNRHCSNVPRGTDAWFEEEEALSTWWGLVIYDRIIGCEPQMNGRPLATRYIRDDDYMPLERNDLDESVGNISEPVLRYFVSATALPGVGTFGRHAQAAYLLDRVLLAVDADALDETRRAELYNLDHALQPLLGTIMEQVGGRWGVYCGATTMVITALYILHQKVLFQPERGVHPDCLEIARVTLNTMTRMVIDISFAFNIESKTMDLDILSPSIAHIVRSAQQHILMAGDFKSEQWLKDFEELRKMLKFIDKRWLIAGRKYGILGRDKG